MKRDGAQEDRRFVIVNAGVRERVFLKDVTRTRSMTFKDGGAAEKKGVMTVYPPDRGREKGILTTAEYTPDPERARRFGTAEEARAYIRKNRVLRYCRAEEA